MSILKVQMGNVAVGDPLTLATQGTKCSQPVLATYRLAKLSLVKIAFLVVSQVKAKP